MPALTRKFHIRKKPVALLLSALIVLATGTAAFAYWTYNGSGTGTGTVSTPTSAVVVRQTSTVANLAPGSAAITLSGTFDNGNSGPVYITTITIGTIIVAKASGVTAACDSTDFTLSATSFSIGREIPNGTSQGSWTGPTIMFNNKPSTNQDGCKGATITIPYTAS